jgi:ankyrin repeat protein
MSLPCTSDAAAMRALDKKCAKPSVHTKRYVKLLSEAPLDYKRSFLVNSTLGGMAHLVRCALEAGTSPDTSSKPGFGEKPVLVAAAYHGATEVLKNLLAAGANTELTDRHGHTALFMATAGKGEVSCVKLLLDAGANANAQDCIGETPLMVAVCNKQVECARTLLPCSDLALTVIQGRNAFHLAIANSSEACFELLLPRIDDVDVRTGPDKSTSGPVLFAHNMTPLHMSCQFGRASMCKALLSRGADKMARDSRQRTPLQYATFGGNLSCVLLLVGRPGKVRMRLDEVNAVTEEGWTALHVAARSGHDQICAVLVDAGARLDAKTSDGATPLMFAQQWQPTNTALLALLSGSAPARPPGMVCDHCGLTAEQASVKSLKACAKCSDVRYCSKECQLAAWPGHKEACKARVQEREQKIPRPVYHRPLGPNEEPGKITIQMTTTG